MSLYVITECGEERQLVSTQRMDVVREADGALQYKEAEENLNVTNVALENPGKKVFTGVIAFFFLRLNEAQGRTLNFALSSPRMSNILRWPGGYVAVALEDPPSLLVNNGGVTIICMKIDSTAQCYGAPLD